MIAGQPFSPARVLPSFAAQGCRRKHAVAANRINNERYRQRKAQNSTPSPQT